VPSPNAAALRSLFTGDGSGLMPSVEERRLPGVGVCYELTTQSGLKLGVVTHKSGTREVLAYEPDDPDTAHELFTVDQDEARTLAELLGGMTVTERLTEIFRTSLHGVTIEWAQVGPDWQVVGRPIGESRLRTRAGVSVVAIIREGETIPSPAPDEEMRADDTLVLVGRPEAVEAAQQILEHGGTAE
jgi:TrkA domain protein